MKGVGDGFDCNDAKKRPEGVSAKRGSRLCESESRLALPRYDLARFLPTLTAATNTHTPPLYNHVNRVGFSLLSFQAASIEW